MEGTTGTETGERGWKTIEELCDRYLGGRPSEAVLQLLRGAETQRPEVRDFVERAFRLMAESRFSPRDMTPTTARFFTVLAPSILPGAWGGMVPPITLPGRHKKIDAYLRSNPWMKVEEGTVFLDIGCGFPPHTSIDAAKQFPECKVIGADVAFEKYLLYDERGNYAVLDANGKVRYFQVVRPEDFRTYYADRDTTNQRFAEAFARLEPDLPPDEGKMVAAERDGMRLLRHPLRGYESANLQFRQGGFGSSDLPAAGIVRSMNVLLYFDAASRREAEAWVAQALRPGGLFVCGRCEGGSLNAHYFVYRSEGGRLVEKEFAFGIESVRQPGWFTLHDDDREAWRLAKMVGILRADATFLKDYDARLDALLAENRIAVRDENGFLGDAPNPVEMARMFPAYEAIARAMEEEFADRAVSVLKAAGLNAWRNSVGHIAVSVAPS